MSDKVGFFEENKDEKSMIRLMSFISLIFAMTCAIITLLFADPLLVSAGVVLTIIFVVGAFAPKCISKFAEIKLESLINK